MVIPHSGGYPHAKFEGYLLLLKFGPHTKSGLTIPQCVRVRTDEERVPFEAGMESLRRFKFE